jgi:GNAT superfamily N-acetyltransferase
MQLPFLADAPHHLQTVAAWVYDEWLRHEPGVTLAQVEDKFRAHCQRDAIPLTILALDEAQTPLGTASLYTEDMATHPHLSPWLAAVYVAPAYRRRGVGAQLVARIEQIAADLGIAQLYLFTPDQVPFYTRLGWASHEQSTYRNHSVTIMTKHMIKTIT